MNASLVAVQLVVGALVVGLLFGRNDRLTRAYVGAWLILNLILLFAYGPEDQLNFYSNDQRHYANIVETVVLHGVPNDFNWWLNVSRWPYTLPAALLSLGGFSATVACKVVSLLFLLGCVRLVRTSIEFRGPRQLILGLYLSALGGVGVLFSVLALRETAMMYLVLHLFLAKSPASRALAGVLLFFLRQHLAVAIVVGLCLMVITRRRNSRNWTPLRAGSTVFAGTILGYSLFSLGFQFLWGSSGVFGHRFGIEPVLRILSNYVGLQFLTAPDESVELSLSSLLVSRLVLSETIVIPAIFTALVFRSRQLDDLGRSVLLVFSIYVGLVTNTEFNSFRQNIPMIPVMGLVVARLLMTSRVARASVATGSRET